MLKELFKNISEPFKSDTIFIIQTYMNAGYECYMVGGPVRDLLLNLSPKDIDFATNCPLEVTKKLFSNVISTGESHGTVTIHINCENYEVTRYRIDDETDGRHATISFASNFEDDSDRRDFTMNSIGYNPITNEIRDPNGGLEDIKHGIIRFVGNTEDRIKEDQLRVLRLLRFIVRLDNLGFTVEREDLELALKSYKHDVVSIERIYQELNKMFDVIRDDRATVVFITETLKGLNIFGRFTTDKVLNDIAIDRIFDSLDFFPLVIMLNGDYSTLKLGHEFGKMYKYFKMFENEDFSNKVIVKDLLTQTDSYHSAKRVLNYFKILNKENNHKEGLITLNTLKNKVGTVDEEPYKITQLDINGKDLMELGLKGIEIGITLNRMLEIVKKDPTFNSKGKLLKLDFLRSK